MEKPRMIDPGPVATTVVHLTGPTWIWIWSG